MINKEGKLLIENKYEKISIGKNNVIRAVKDGQEMILDIKNYCTLTDPLFFQFLKCRGIYFPDAVFFLVAANGFCGRHQVFIEFCF